MPAEGCLLLLVISLCVASERKHVGSLLMPVQREEEGKQERDRSGQVCVCVCVCVYSDRNRQAFVHPACVFTFHFCCRRKRRSRSRSDLMVFCASLFRTGSGISEVIGGGGEKNVV